MNSSDIMAAFQDEEPVDGLLKINEVQYEDLEGEDPGDTVPGTTIPAYQRPVFVQRPDYAPLPDSSAADDMHYLKGERFFTADTELDSVICVRCRTCVPTSNLEGHLRGVSHKVSLKKQSRIGAVVCTREELKDYCAKFSHCHNEKHIKSLPLAHPMLMEPVEGQKCLECCHLFVHSVKKSTCPECKSSQLNPVYCQSYYPTTGGKQKGAAPVIGKFPRYFEVLQPMEDRGDQGLREAVPDVTDMVYTSNHRPYVQDIVRPDSQWLSRTGWLIHLNTIARDAIRDKWKDCNIPSLVLLAHDMLMEDVLKVAESPDTHGLRVKANVRNADLEKYSEKPVMVPVFKEKYLATFRKLFCIIVSLPKLFLFTPNHRAAYNIMMNNPKSLTVLGFWHSVVCYFYDNCAPYQPLEAGLAALNWDDKNAVFRSPMQATQIMAHVMLLIRLMLVYYSMCSSNIMKRHGSMFLTPSQVFRRDCGPFIQTTQGSDADTPVGKILSLWAYGRAISETSTGNVQCTLATEGIISTGSAVTTEAHIKAGITRLVDDLEALVVDLVGKSVSALDPRKFIDNMQVRSPGTRVGESPADKKMLWDWAGGDPMHMMNRAWKSKIYNGAFFAKVQCQRSFFVKVVRFKELLLAALQLTGGSPARCSEILTLKLMNTCTEMRNVEFGVRGTALAYRYNKTQWTGVEKTVHRFLPEKVGRALLVYIAVIHPFIMNINQLVYNKEHPDELRGLVQSAHIFQSQYRERDLDQLDDDDTAERSDNYEQLCDGVFLEDLWTLDRARTVLKVMMTKYFTITHGAMNVSSWRHCQALILKKRVVFQPGSGGIDFHAEQFGHSAETARRHYGIDIDLDPGSTEDRVTGFHRASVAWHRYVGLDSPLPLSEHARDRVRDRVVSLQGTDWRQLLCKLTGKDCYFKPGQKEAIDRINRREHELVIVMGTGAGKSLLFMLPAFAMGPTGLTIVVSPLRALIEDMTAKYSAMGVQCGTWDKRGNFEDCSVVLVTPERFISDEFAVFFNKNRQSGRLHNLFYDEAHSITSVDGDAPWRDALQQCNNLSRLGTQTIYLTATLPPSKEEVFFGRSNLRSASVIRHPTSRPELRYECVRDMHSVASIRQDISRAGGRVVLIFVHTRNQAENEAKILGCGYYHAQLDNATKKKVFEEVRDGTRKLLVTTSALSCGIDVPGVGMVIHLETPRCLVSYAQETGRAGRGGESAICKLYAPPPEDEDTLERYNVGDPRGYVEMTECLRGKLSEYLDGKWVSCATLPGCNKCCVCDRISDHVSDDADDADDAEVPLVAQHDGRWLDCQHRQAAIEASFESRASMSTWYSKVYSKYAHKLQNLCIPCYFDGVKGCEYCDKAKRGAKAFFADYRQVMGSYKKKVAGSESFIYTGGPFAKYSCCFDCGQPMQECTTTPSSNGKRKCNNRKYQGILFVLQWWKRRKNVANNRVHERFTKVMEEFCYKPYKEFQEFDKKASDYYSYVVEPGNRYLKCTPWYFMAITLYALLEGE
jgi:superfamily II DNA or RNA helicase/predicted Zn-ribbon and HTH transcriptional regulator